MPEMSTKFVPKHMGDKNPNPKLLKFVRHVTDRVPGKIKMTTDAPEYWVTNNNGPDGNKKFKKNKTGCRYQQQNG